MADVPVSLVHLRWVGEDLLSARLEEVKVLREDDTDCYRLVKDASTGEHYLHYAVRHVNVAAGGLEESYHHLMPIAHDDVIALALGAETYAFPAFWTSPYLRNGPNGGYVWYDPDGARTEDDALRYETLAAEIRGKLEAYRRSGKAGPEELERLMREMDGLFGDK